MPATKLGVNVKIARNKHLPSKGYSISHDRFWQIPTKSPDILKILRFEHHPKWWLFSFKWAYFFKIKIHSFQTSLLIRPNQRYHDFIQLGPLESDKQLWSGLEMVHFDWMIVDGTHVYLWKWQVMSVGWGKAWSTWPFGGHFGSRPWFWSDHRGGAHGVSGTWWHFGWRGASLGWPSLDTDCLTGLLLLLGLLLWDDLPGQLL